MKKIVCFLAFSFSLSLFASGDHGHKHGHEKSSSSLGAHVHGELECSIAVDQKEIYLQLKAPAQSLIGFEYRPKTEEEKKKWKTFTDSWKKNLLNSFSMTDIKCEILKPLVLLNVDEKGSHAQIYAEALLRCPKSLQGKTMNVTLRQKFEAIKKIDFDVLPATKPPYKRSISKDLKTLELEL